MHGAAAMLDRRTVHAFALVTTLLAAQLAARTVLAHVEVGAGERPDDGSTSR